MAARHAVGVHNPRHHLSICIDIGSRDVAVGADEVRDFVGVAAREAFQFTMRKILGIADDASLRATEGNVDRGALPCHPGGQRLHFIETYIGMIANTALARPARIVVLYAKSLKYLDVAIVHLDGQMK